MTIENNPWEAKNVGKLIGSKLRQIRVNKSLSMEALAKQIGISKLTLGQIERGEANPTLSLIWKIANGLSVPVTSLLSVETDVSIARRKKGLKLTGSDDVFTVEPLFSNKQNSFELYRGYLKPHTEYLSEAHAPGVEEFIIVMSGSLVVEVEGKTYELDEFDSIRFGGDSNHKYINTSSNLTVLHFVISYNSPTLKETVLFTK